MSASFSLLFITRWIEDVCRLSHFSGLAQTVTTFVVFIKCSTPALTTHQAYDSSRQYNEMVVLKVLDHSASLITQPLPAFEHEIRTHFRLNGYA